MFESHRLTPMSNHAVVLGYLIGGGGHPLMMFGVNVVFGTILSFLGQQPPALWLCGNAMLLAGSLPLWALVILCGLRLGKPLSPAVILFAAGLLGGALFMVLPAAAVVTSGFTIVLGFMVGFGQMSASEPALPICAVLSLLLTVFWLHLAALKFRRPDLPVLSGYRGLFMLLVWLALGVGSVLAALDMTNGPWDGRLAETAQALWITTFSVTLFVALIPITGCIECRRLACEGRALRDRSDGMSSLAAALVAGALVCAAITGLRLSIWDDWKAGGPNPDLGSFACTLFSCVLALLFVRGLWIVLKPKTTTSHTLLVLLILVLWAAPLAVDAFLAGRFGHSWSALGGCSPCGSLHVLWRGEISAPLLPGLIVQGLPALLLTWLAHRAERTRHVRADRAASAVPPPRPNMPT